MGKLYSDDKTYEEICQEACNDVFSASVDKVIYNLHEDICVLNERTRIVRERITALETLNGDVESDISEIQGQAEKLRNHVLTMNDNKLQLITEELERLCEQARSREL